jgi:hypothetical protein
VTAPYVFFLAHGLRPASALACPSPLTSPFFFFQRFSFVALSSNSATPPAPSTIPLLPTSSMVVGNKFTISPNPSLDRVPPPSPSVIYRATPPALSVIPASSRPPLWSLVINLPSHQMVPPPPPHRQYSTVPPHARPPLTSTQMTSDCSHEKESLINRTGSGHTVNAGTEGVVEFQSNNHVPVPKPWTVTQPS